MGATPCNETPPPPLNEMSGKIMGATPWNETPPPPLNEMSSKIMVGSITTLVMVLVFVLLVHLYARWFWSRHGGAEIHRLRRSRSRLVFAPTQEPLHRGLEPSVVEALPLVIFKQEDFKDGLECAVCLCEIEDGEKARLLPKCNHGFHVECIDMWFYSHSTCPLCRITVGADSSESSSPGTQTEEVNSGSDSVRSIELSNFPTSVLFGGNDTDSSVSAGNNGPEEGPANFSLPQSPCSSMYATPNSSRTREGSLIIDIPAKPTEGFSSQSLSASKSTEEEMKSPMSERFRSLTRLLSREKRAIPSSPGSVDVERGEIGRGQSSKTPES